MRQLPQLTDIVLEQSQSTLIATLNRPKAKNALSGEMVDGLMSLCDFLVTTPDIRSFVLRGAGGVFCAGGDIKDFVKLIAMPEPKTGERDPLSLIHI